MLVTYMEVGKEDIYLDLSRSRVDGLGRNRFQYEIPYVPFKQAKTEIIRHKSGMAGFLVGLYVE